MGIDGIIVYCLDRDNASVDGEEERRYSWLEVSFQCRMRGCSDATLTKAAGGPEPTHD
jgi:hypothetical protein